jgi:uncharacterized protein
MRILRDIIAGLETDAPIREVRRGLFWTAVVSRRCGLASTMMGESCPGGNQEHTVFDPHAGKTAQELALLSLSGDVLEASLGLAAMNSLIEVDMSSVVEVNAGDLLMEHGKDKSVAVIGHFPFSDSLRRTAKNLWILERRPKPGDFPERDAETYLPRSDVVAISSTTLINHTLAEILRLCPPASVKILLGPTTPMTQVLFDYGIDVLSGSVVTDTAAALRYIGEGANFRQLKGTGCIKLLTMTKNSAKGGLTA